MWWNQSDITKNKVSESVLNYQIIKLKQVKGAKIYMIIPHVQNWSSMAASEEEGISSIWYNQYNKYFY